MKNYQQFLISLALAIIIFIIPLFRSGDRDLGIIENIHGRPFPRQNNTTYITEKIAHADIYLTEPVLGKKILLDLTLRPGNSQNITLGIRHQSFWLGYHPVTIYTAENSSPPNEITATVSIPLTDKFQEPDRSIDLMFFTDYVPANPGYDLGSADETDWQLLSITARTAPALPSAWELIDYAASLMLRERAI